MDSANSLTTVKVEFNTPLLNCVYCYINVQSGHLLASDVMAQKELWQREPEPSLSLIGVI